MSNYPRDEFDRVPESSSRQGVHRARLEPPKGGGLALIVTAGIIVLAIGAAAFFLLPNLGLFDRTGPAADETATEQTSSTADPSAESGSDATADGATNEPVSEDTETAASQDEAETAPADSDNDADAADEGGTDNAAVDKTTGVVVLNSTSVVGMAGDASDRLTAEGWPVTFVGNWAGQPQPSSVVFYNGPDQLANAEAVAETLGIDRLVDTADFQQPLTVVLGPGFQ